MNYLLYLTTIIEWKVFNATIQKYIIQFCSYMVYYQFIILTIYWTHIWKVETLCSNAVIHTKRLWAGKLIVSSRNWKVYVYMAFYVPCTFWLHWFECIRSDSIQTLSDSNAHIHKSRIMIKYMTPTSIWSRPNTNLR